MVHAKSQEIKETLEYNKRQICEMVNIFQLCSWRDTSMLYLKTIWAFNEGVIVKSVSSWDKLCLQKKEGVTKWRNGQNILLFSNNSAIEPRLNRYRPVTMTRTVPEGGTEHTQKQDLQCQGSFEVWCGCCYQQHEATPSLENLLTTNQ